MWNPLNYIATWHCERCARIFYFFSSFLLIKTCTVKRKVIDISSVFSCEKSARQRFLLDISCRKMYTILSLALRQQEKWRHDVFVALRAVYVDPTMTRPTNLRPHYYKTKPQLRNEDKTYKSKAPLLQNKDPTTKRWQDLHIQGPTTTKQRPNYETKTRPTNPRPHYHKVLTNEDPSGSSVLIVLPEAVDLAFLVA
jgi:hypothetical protein